MSRLKKIFLTICVLFVAGVAYFSYDVSSRTTFPGSKSQLKERLKKQYFKQDSAIIDTAKATHRP